MTAGETFASPPPVDVPGSYKGSIDITGTVTNEKGEPAAGVTVSIKGGTGGTITDEKGRYTLKSETVSVTLVFSGVNYITKEVRAEGNTVNVSLETVVKEMERAIVVGYGMQKKSDVTGAISSISGKDIEKMPVTDIASALQGRAAGVVVTQGDGSPGATADIIIRGAASINGLGPLYVIDGVPSGNSNNFNTQDIQSVEILKDAGSASIYGVGAAGGVILITTKHGRKGESPVINFSSYYGVRKMENPYHLLNTTDFLAARKAYGNDISGWGDPATLPNTDWMKELYHDGREQNYTLSMSGGANRVNYYLSGNFEQQDGLKVTTQFKRYSLRFNSDYQISSRVKFGETLYGYKTTGVPDVDGTLPFRSVPTMAVHDIRNPYGGWGKQPQGGYYAGNNPLASQMQNHFDNQSYGFNGSLYINWDIVTGLSFRTTMGASLGGNNNAQFAEAYDVGSLSNHNAVYDKSFGKGEGLMANYTLTYEHGFGLHHLKVLAGYEARKSTGTDISGNWIGFVTPVAQSSALSTSTTQKATASVGEGRVLSQFGRLNYDYQEKYLLTASIRRDGEDKFGPANRYGVFPSATAGWHISKELFMEFARPLLSDLKIRGGYGVLGNDGALGSFQYEPSYSAINITAFAPGDRSQGWGITTMPNYDIKWEEVRQTDVGLDMGFLQNHLSVTVDWYNRQTHNMIYNVSTPPTTGVGPYNGDPALIPENIGLVSNKGFELTLGYNDEYNGFHYDIMGTVTVNKNKVLKLGFDTIPFPSGFAGDAWNSATSLTQIGHPMGSFFGYVAQGLFKTDADAGSSGQTNARAGDIRYLDLNKDGSINSGSDQTYIGNPWPSVVYSLNLNLSYKGFDLSALFTGVSGVDLYNGMKAYTENFNGDYNTTKDIFKASGFNGNGVTSTPSVGYFDNSSSSYIRDPNGNFKNISSYFVESGSYFKLKNLQLGYNFASKLVQRAGGGSLRIYVMANNLFTVTKYTGIDPELAGSVTSRGVDNLYAYPHSRLYAVGLNLGF
jgi:TonB-linked SusC/RagA family outer membrane protein